MPSAYLAPPECEFYKVPDADMSDIQQASTIIDAYLERPEGLVWAPDGSGLPCYMAGLSPALSFTLPGALTPGLNKTIAFPAASAGMTDLIGEVFVLDRANSGLCEAVTISAIDVAHGTATFARVAFSHAMGATMETGLTIVEDRAMAAKRSLTRVSRSPIVRLLSGMGRYSYGRRSDQIAGLGGNVNLLAEMQVFGGAPAWVPFDATQASISVATGEVWIPAGMLLSNYSDVRLRYVAGFPAASIPSGVKQATADIIRFNQEFPDVPGSFKTFAAGGTKLERFSDTVLDADTKSRLEPYRLKLFF
jgi:hypothetical protein